MGDSSANAHSGRGPPAHLFGLVTSDNLALVVAITVVMGPILSMFILPVVVRLWGRVLGWYLRKKSEGRKSQILRVMEEDQRSWEVSRSKRKEKNGSDSEWENIEAYSVGTSKNGEKGEEEWDGMVGFFHPFCNAGGGGERVLWAAIRATQRRWPKAKCVVYTGDHDVDKASILARVQNRFNIDLHHPTISFLYLSTRSWVLASTWPHFTLLGQSLGSMIMLWDAMSLAVPDIFVDTMGYAFALGFCKFLFPKMPTGAYVHYPTISTDMLDSLNPESAVGKHGVNAGKGVGAKGFAKTLYWRIFAQIYSWVGGSVDIVMTNSSWTQAHIKSLWGPFRWNKTPKKSPIAVVYPPVAVSELEQAIEISQASEKKREKLILYIAQFRPEKNHELIIQAFAEFLKMKTPATENAKLVLVGSVRDDHDKKRVYQLRLLVNELHIRDQVQFHRDAAWEEILEWLRTASVGVNGMWNEHFGIGVVEYQAAGLIAVVHNSGGPKLDIVTEIDGEDTGYHATTAEEFAEAFDDALSLPNPTEMRLRARQSAKRFTEEVFAQKWTEQMEKLVAMLS